ncbi:MAG: aspartate aminotransferase family protein [Actinobacteria bacterium]|nr:MAG: aspartate aminotransferase family protein [Actinomycetota bacterium]
MAPALEYLQSLQQRRVYPESVDPDDLRRALGGPMPTRGAAPEMVVADLARQVEPYVTSHATGRFFGFVIGGLHPASYGADLLASTWDQNTGLFPVTPGVAAIEEVAVGWLLELLDLPSESSVGLVTGGQMANFTCLAAARNHVLRETDWDVEALGLQNAPKVNVLVKEDGHTTVLRSLRYLGLGTETAIPIECDDQARIVPEALERALADLEGPTIICVEAAQINTGSFDPFAEVADIADRHRERGDATWVHVDGAIGLWARAASSHREMTEGLERLDSWSTDAHKLLNVGYDSGIAICRHAAAHRAAMSTTASYLVQSDGETRDPMDWNPEFSRRARGLALYATLRSLGREGVDDLVFRTHALARRFAEQLAESGLARIENEVVFNQVLVRWLGPNGEDESLADRIMDCVRTGGEAYFSGTTVDGERLMRISVSDWATDEDDVDRAVAALLECARQVVG